MFRVFSKDENYFLFLTKFKQLFSIDQYTYDFLMSDSIDIDKKKELVSEYEDSTNEVDSYLSDYSEFHRYGLFLGVSNSCNAMCSYCFASQGDYGKKRGLMDKSTAVKSIDFFMKKVPNKCEANIIFFGGEPTLAFNTIVQTCDYIKNKYSDRNYKLHIVTNATLLNEKMIDFLSDNNFSMGISIDGGEKVQNLQRPLRGGKSSFYEATKNLNYIFDKMPYVHARGTFSDFNGSLVSAYKDLLELGFKEVSIPPDLLNYEQNKEFDKLLNQLDLLYDFVIEYSQNNDDFPFTVFVESIRRIFMAKLDIDYTCGVGESIFSTDINGDIYPCHRFSSEKEFCMGNVSEVTNLTSFTYKSTQCKSCWNQYTCSHGCCYNDYFLEKDIKVKNQYWCMYSQKMTELSLQLIQNLEYSKIANILGVR